MDIHSAKQEKEIKRIKIKDIFLNLEGQYHEI